MDPRFTFEFRDWAPADASAVIRVNDAEVPHVSALSLEGLSALAAQAFHFRIAASGSGDIAALVLALDEKADYASPNFTWFRDRYERFIYIDRVVVAAPYQGRGLGRLLYEGLQE